MRMPAVAPALLQIEAHSRFSLKDGLTDFVIWLKDEDMHEMFPAL